MNGSVGVVTSNSSLVIDGVADSIPLIANAGACNLRAPTGPPGGSSFYFVPLPCNITGDPSPGAAAAALAAAGSAAGPFESICGALDLQCEWDGG